MANIFLYSGKVSGTAETNENGTKVFKGLVGELPVWLFGKNASLIEELMGQNVLLSGAVSSREWSDNRYFVQTNVYNIIPAGNTEHNTVALKGTVVSVRKIKENLQEALVAVPITTWDRKKRKSVKTENLIPVVSQNVVESDVGKEMHVIARIQVSQGRYINLRPQHISYSGKAPENEELDPLLT